MGKQYKQMTGLLIVVLGLVVVLSACGSVSTPLTSASATPEMSTTNSLEVTSQVALPNVSSTADPTTVQATATLPVVFDLTRTKDNPITDAQQIIEILNVLENIQRAQPVPPGWYLRSSIDLEDPENSEHFYNLYHIIGENLNCELVMQFELGPEENILWSMAQNYGTPIHTIPGSLVTLDYGTPYENICDSPNSPYSFYFYYLNAFSNKYYYSLNETAVDWDGDYSFAAWFEDEEGELLFILQEKTDNIQAGYITDPDTNESVLVRSEETIKTFSVGVGLIVESQSIMNLANNNVIRRTSINQREYFHEMTELPPSVLAYLEESLLLYDDMQMP